MSDERHVYEVFLIDPWEDCHDRRFEIGALCHDDAAQKVINAEYKFDPTAKIPDVRFIVIGNEIDYDSAEYHPASPPLKRTLRDFVIKPSGWAATDASGNIRGYERED